MLKCVNVIKKNDKFSQKFRKPFDLKNKSSKIKGVILYSFYFQKKNNKLSALFLLHI